MDGRAGEFGEEGVALDDDFLARRRPAGQSERGADRAFVHHAFADEIVVLAMVHDGEAKHARVLQRAAHDLMVLDTMPVVGERDDARFVHRADGREFLARDAFRNRAGGEDVHARLGLRFFQNPRHHARAVDARRSIRHAHDAREATRRRSLRPAGDSLFRRLARLAQVNVEVDEAGTNDEAARVDHFQVVAVLPRQTIEVNFFDLPIGQVNVADAINAIGRIDDVAVGDEGGGHGRSFGDATSPAKRRAVCSMWRLSQNVVSS